MKPSEVSNQELSPTVRRLTGEEVIHLLDTQAFFDSVLKQPYPSQREKVLDHLFSENILIRSNGHYQVTQLGALLFAKRLQDFDLSRKAIRVIKYAGQNKLVTEKDHTFQEGYIRSFESCLLYLNGLLPSNEIIEQATRRQLPMYPPLALRELISNAIIHQDLQDYTTQLCIEIYTDRIEISNPGAPVLEPQRFIDRYKSRNLHLANMMRRAGLCEEKGSGIDKVINLSEVFQLPAPEFRAFEQQTVAILYAPKALDQMNKDDRIRATYQHCSLLYVSNQKMSNESLRERFKTDSTKASRIIKEALQAKLIRLEDPENKSRRFVSYLPFWA